jgi:hypothetical protein
MANYGEVLGYWYLRLNGFFPLSNFVLHREGDEKHSSDCDVLAVRFPYVYEPIGGNPFDWDPDLFDGLGVNIENDEQIIGLIVQVKTGRFTRDDMLQAFSLANLSKAISRMGIFPQIEVQDVALALDSSPVVSWAERRVVLGKLAIVVNPWNCGDEPNYLVFTLDKSKDFIRQRMLNYSDPKSADRLLFPDPLIQFFASETGINEYFMLRRAEAREPNVPPAPVQRRRR